MGVTSPGKVRASTGDSSSAIRECNSAVARYGKREHSPTDHDCLEHDLLKTPLSEEAYRK